MVARPTWAYRDASSRAELDLRRQKDEGKGHRDCRGERSGGVTVALDPVPAGAQLATTTGLTLFIRRDAGLTSRLKPQKELLTRLEGPNPSNPTAAVLQSDRSLLIGGGIGITGLLPYLWSHPNAKLFHSVKAADQCLVEPLLS